MNTELITWQDFIATVDAISIGADPVYGSVM
jgi:hypothetical protein